ncbi:TlpA family protein disulfide reductase [Parachryseolinea silvisoli]|uniref:TlpA family protein disulfide reductase n=1 Tax=Parachryseolinea silvisoli TaxID=2873601 RepID=UPI002265C12F|nr:TlpA disulfide reductase family protein [Parachryseolinea silvisoli]MCD9014421.1 TlpA family protein disulfide reductase [Parachryseolinea silvisoli]
MKKHLPLLLLFFFLCWNVYAQTIIENPTHGYSNAQGLTLRKIALTDTATILHFHLLADAGADMYIPDDAFIQPVTGGQKRVIRYAEGIPLSEEYVIPASGEVYYTLVFPALEKHTTKFDYIEGEEGWTIFDIQTGPEAPWSSPIPQSLAGHWLNTATGNWELSLFDYTAVYEKQVWRYGKVSLKNGSGTVQLTNGSQAMSLSVMKDKNGAYKFGKGAQKAVAYSRLDTHAVARHSDQDAPFEIPVFALDTAVYSGYIRHYRPHLGSTTLQVRINDLISGGENSFVTHIAENGYFTVKVPLYHPQDVYVESPYYYTGHLFLEPGKALFELIDADQSHFMGEGAVTNSELQQLEGLGAGSHAADVQAQIPNITADAYKGYWRRWQERDLEVLDSLAKKGSISPRTFQIKRKDLVYQYLNVIPEYEMLMADALEADSGTANQNTPGIKSDSLTPAFFDGITDELANDPLAVVADSYYYFINRLRYLDFIRTRINWSISGPAVFAALEKTGYVLTDRERQLRLDLQELDSLQAHNDFSTRYKAAIEAFQQKYSGVYSAWAVQQPEPPTFSAIETYLRGKKVKFTQDEIHFLTAARTQEGNVTSARLRALRSATTKPANDFNLTHHDFLSALNKKLIHDSYVKNLEALLGVKRGLATDLIAAQTYCRSIVAEKTPVTSRELKFIQDQISSPFIAHYVALRNEQSRRQLASPAGAVNPGYDANESGTNSADSIFNRIVATYKGNVIYVDFWATWCGPCLADMAEIAPLKDELANENITFVYITDQSSPKKAWSNMIPGIKGEHYRVSKEEWMYLCSKFNIVGIPHHVLVGKNGEVINPDVRLEGNASLRKELRKHVDQ